jgi:hypothetical protein
MLSINATSLGLTHMENELPERVQALILDVVLTRQGGRARALTLPEAALLREHDLIDHVGRPTSRGLAVAGDFLGFQEGK